MDFHRAEVTADARHLERDRQAQDGGVRQSAKLICDLASDSCQVFDCFPIHGNRKTWSMSIRDGQIELRAVCSGFGRVAPL